MFLLGIKNADMCFLPDAVLFDDVIFIQIMTSTEMLWMESGYPVENSEFHPQILIVYIFLTLKSLQANFLAKFN